MTDNEDVFGVSTSDIEIYQQFLHEDISRSRAKDLIGDNWETVAQLVSIMNAQKSNEENGHSPDELAEFLASDEEGGEDYPADETELWEGIEDAKNDKFVRPDDEFEF